MKILFVTSEAYPLLKTGGLADVAGALPAALAALGEDVRILLPAYPDAVAAAKDKQDAISLGDPLGVGEVRLIKARMPVTGTELWLIDCPALYDRAGNPYTQKDGTDWPDNPLRFAMLSRVAAMLSVPGNATGWTADIVHANDWQGGLTAAYLHFWGGRHARSVFTVHNLQYQGLFKREILPQAGLPEAAFSVDGLEFHDKVSFLKSGLYYSDAITTVSPTYAKEIMGDALGCGLDGLLRLRSDVLSGVLNGVDDETWNPATDKHLDHRYSLARRTGKAKNKTALQAELGLPSGTKAPLLGMVTRLTAQKGIDLVVNALPALRKSGFQLAVLGTGDTKWERALSDLAATDPNISVRIGYDEAMAHRIIAASDVFLMPSRFEPCGLTQMYALRYGTLPLVRKTGGLADTVVDVRQGDSGTGFVFEPADGAALSAAAARAAALFKNVKAWRKVQRTAMQQDFSWAHAAQAYQKLYRDLAAKTA